MDEHPFGPPVLLVRVDKHNKVHSEWLPVGLAIAELSSENILNGTYWKSGRIDADNEVDIGKWDFSI